jgi:glutamyl-tRNA reductase
MKLVLVGTSHHRAPVELRERVALDRERAAEAAEQLAAGGAEAVVLSTCNRTEAYVVHRDEAAAETIAMTLFADPELSPALYRLRDEAAALHLFRVAAGLDSLVPGEGEILGQVREAYEAGSAGPLLDRLFRTALHAGRRARSETAIAESPASVPAAAAALAQQVFETLTGRRVLVVGAGAMSEQTARNLVSRGATVAAVANRSEERGAEFAGRLGVRAVPLSSVADELAAVDVVVASTSASQFVLVTSELGEVIRGRRGRPLLFIDLAVPRDVDPALARLDGCFVYDIDDLEAVVEASLAGRRAEAVRAERVVAGEAERFREWQASLAVVPAIASLRQLAEDIRAHELDRARDRLGRLPERDRRLVESMTAQIVNKLLHEPTVRMKEAAVTADGVVYAEVVRHLFGLGEEERGG